MLPMDPEAVMDLLQSTPALIAALCRDRTADQLAKRPAARSWSAIEVLAHIRACADVWGNNIARIHEGDHPTIRHTSPRTRTRKANYAELDFETSFREFAQQRKSLLLTLQCLAPEDWERSATVKIDDTSHEETILSYAHRLAEHEAGHVDQIQRALVPGEARAAGA